MNELTVLGDKSLRPMADDLAHALIRTQQAVGLAGNIFTGGIEEVVFDAKINPNPTEASRFGSPAAGESFRFRPRIYELFPQRCPFLCLKLMTIIPVERWASVPRQYSDQICRMAHQTRAEQRDMGHRRTLAENQPRSSVDRLALEPELVGLLVPYFVLDHFTE